MSTEKLVEALRAILPDAEANHCGGPDTAARLAAAREALAAHAEQPAIAPQWVVSVLPVVVRDVPDAHRVQMTKGVQTFNVGMDFWDTREEAEGYAQMLREALAPQPPASARILGAEVDAARYRHAYQTCGFTRVREDGSYIEVFEHELDAEIAHLRSLGLTVEGE